MKESLELNSKYLCCYKSRIWSWKGLPRLKASVFVWIQPCGCRQIWVLAAHWDPQVLFCKVAPQSGQFQCVLHTWITCFAGVKVWREKCEWSKLIMRENRFFYVNDFMTENVTLTFFFCGNRSFSFFTFCCLYSPSAPPKPAQECLCACLLIGATHKLKK